MKCPKCAYLGFETSERCRNCGYDFSLSVHIESSSDLALRDAQASESALSDFDLSGLETSPPTSEPSGGLDLDRILGAAGIGVASSADALGVSRERGRAVETTSAVATPPPAELQAEYQQATGAAEPLPLFVEPWLDERPGPRAAPEAPGPDTLGAVRDPPRPGREPPLPRPARPPLAVRRATPEVQRRRTPRPLRRDDGVLALQLEPAGAAPAAATRDGDSVGSAVAPRAARLGAALVDLMLLAGIDAAVLYLTLAIAGLPFEHVRRVPAVPMGAFLLLLNGGYLSAFTAAGGQTIGKMLTGTRVIGDDGRGVDLGGAMLRALGCAVSLLTLGLGYLPALLTTEGRALQDRLAGTRVIKI